MDTVSSYMTSDHHRCDELFALAEEAVSGQNWHQIDTVLQTFLESMHHHFKMEEEVLFPAFENRTGMTMGPTEMMRMEHIQMRELFEAMNDAVKHKDKDEFLGQAETLLVVMQQHNMKEEQMLYLMADRALAEQMDVVLQQLRDVDA